MKLLVRMIDPPCWTIEQKSVVRIQRGVKEMSGIMEAEFDIEVEGLIYLGRGPGAVDGSIGWRTGDNIFYRCVKCGSFMKSSIRDDYRCECGAMGLDYEYGSFGSNYGDQNILVYRKS